MCDAASRRCVDGCHIDPDCGEATGRICDAATHLCAQGCRSDADCPEHLGCVIASGDTGVCSFELVPIVDEQPSCAVSEGSKSRDMTAYLLLAMASLALVRRRSSSSK